MGPPWRTHSVLILLLLAVVAGLVLVLAYVAHAREPTVHLNAPSAEKSTGKMSDYWSAVIAAVSGLLGVTIGGCLTLRRDANDRRYRFLKAQADEFYGPLVGIRAEIRAKSQLRAKLHSVANEQWQKRLEGRSPQQVEIIDKAEESGYAALIAYDNEQLRTELLPAYKDMLSVFKAKMGLAEPSTLEHYSVLVEFLELWERWRDSAIPGRVVRALDHSEVRLNPLYEDLETQLTRLRNALRQGKGVR